MIRPVRFLPLFVLATVLAGCASAPSSVGPPASAENLAAVGEMDFGREPTEDEVAGPIMDWFYPKVLASESRYSVKSARVSHQHPPYHKCLLESSRGANSWYAGYCVGFSYALRLVNIKDTKNYTSGSAAQGWVHIDEAGALTGYVWTSDRFYDGGASSRSGLITEATGVRILDHRGLVSLPLRTYSFVAGGVTQF